MSRLNSGMYALMIVPKSILIDGSEAHNLKRFQPSKSGNFQPRNIAILQSVNTLKISYLTLKNQSFLRNISRSRSSLNINLNDESPVK
jgi:hypothetical protein